MKDCIEKLIRGYLKQHFIECPVTFQENLIDSMTQAKVNAMGYWDTRNDDEILRDAMAGVTEADYIIWVLKELLELKKVELGN